MTELSGKVDTLLRDAHAQAEARGHPFVGTEHLLLAMTRQSEDCFARRLLDEAGVTNTLRARIEAVIGPSGPRPWGRACRYARCRVGVWR